jgi:hypothetical protein
MAMDGYIVDPRSIDVSKFHSKDFDASTVSEVL